VTIRFDGADLSHHQDDAGPIDWPTLRAASTWVATKATQGDTYTDPTFAAHWAEMGVGFKYRLAYHWLTPDADPAAQAAHFLAVWDRTGGAMLDAEQAGITAAMVLAWCEAVEAVTHRPCSVYTGAYVTGGTIWQSTAIRTSAYGRRPMHLAAYTTEAKALKLPGVAAYPWSAWQYSSNGPGPGVTGRCDMNRIDVTAHYDLACFAPPTPPEDPDMATMHFTCPDLPGEYMWTPGSDPIPFATAADRDATRAGLGITGPAVVLTKVMYDRLFVKPVEVTIPPVEVTFPAMHVVTHSTTDSTGTIG
jgi:GH25 family lysozyme M1 (1,4-beta-N-acetylmuramidase)